VVDVGDDGDVAKVRTWHRRARLARGRASSYFPTVIPTTADPGGGCPCPSRGSPCRRGSSRR
jgi:hypothetical protein